VSYLHRLSPVAKSDTIGLIEISEAVNASLQLVLVFALFASLADSNY
jgi:hypothetical protein